jgi:hypothetical protein
MTNVTISMDDTDLAWVRAQAGAAGVSVSRWMAEQVLNRRKRDMERAASAERIKALYAEIRTAQSQVPVISDTQTIREMLEEVRDERFRRFDDDPVYVRSTRPGEDRDMYRVAEPSSGFQSVEDEPSGSE